MSYYPPYSFHFSVAFTGVRGTGESSFAEIAGLDAERTVFEIAEGGENRFTHRLPERAKYGNLVLKRGILLGDSGLAKWCKDVLESDLAKPIETKDLDVVLLDMAGEPLMSWNFKRAWPAKWSVSSLAADKNELAIETLELAYAWFSRSANMTSAVQMLATT